MYYSILKKILFRFDPEATHRFALNALRIAHQCKLAQLIPPPPANPMTVMGLLFPNPIGLAAGLDKNGDYIDALAALGFGFIEVGTVTTRPQLGNPKPRVFRLPEQEAIINRLGFVNKGIDYLIKQIRKAKYKGILGINIGKNTETPAEDAIAEYLYLFRRVSLYASYVTINISSPNSKGLRTLQQPIFLEPLLQTLKKEQRLFRELHKKHIPLVVKIAPDLNSTELEEIAAIFIKENIDGVIATNTSVQRFDLEPGRFASEAGGLSGKPLRQHATQMIQQLQMRLEGKIPIIASGGIFDKADMLEKLSAGASLIQLYSGLIYRGPSLVYHLTRALPSSSSAK